MTTRTTRSHHIQRNSGYNNAHFVSFVRHAHTTFRHGADTGIGPISVLAQLTAFLLFAFPAHAALQVCSKIPTAAAVTHQWVNAISAGSTSLSQPAFTDISGSVAASQMPALTGDVTTSAGAVATTLATVNTNTGSFGSSSQVATFTVNGKGLITAASNVTIPVKPTGEVFMTAQTSCPTGSISADGTSELRSGGTGCGGGSCANLFTAISTTYGTVDGTHFTLPNIQGVFPRGAGSQTISAISYTGTQGTTQGDQMQGHFHSISIPNNIFQNAGGNSYANGANAHNAQTPSITIGAPTTDGTNGTPRTGTQTQPANVVLLFCIVY